MSRSAATRATLLGLTAGTIALTLACAESATPTAPSTTGVSVLPATSGGTGTVAQVTGGRGQTKTALCHWDAETEAYKLLSLPAPALAPHLAHGDVYPGTTVDDDCGPLTEPVTIDFTHDDFLRSTSVIAAPVSPAPALPPGSSFTLARGDQTGLDSFEGTFWRYVFNLPTGYSDLSFSLTARANDIMAVYVNGTVVAVQDDTANVNANNYILDYGFTLNPGGTVDPYYAVVVAGSNLWDDWDFLSVTQGDFQAGVNELTIYVKDTCCGGGSKPGLWPVSGSFTYLP